MGVGARWKVGFALLLLHFQILYNLQFLLSALGLAVSVVASQLIGGVLGNVLNKVVQVAAALVLLGHLVLRVPVDGGEAVHDKLRWHIIGSGVHLHNLNTGLVLQGLAQLFVSRSQVLAVTAPGSVYAKKVS